MSKTLLVDNRGVRLLMHYEERNYGKVLRPGVFIDGDITPIRVIEGHVSAHKSGYRKHGVTQLVNWAVGWRYL